MARLEEIDRIGVVAHEGMVMIIDYVEDTPVCPSVRVYGASEEDFRAFRRMCIDVARDGRTRSLLEISYE